MRNNNRLWGRGAIGFLLLLLTASLSERTHAQTAGASSEIQALLEEMMAMSQEALAAAEEASAASRIEDVKRAADTVFRVIWGIESGLAEPGASGEIPFHGWKEQWQVDETHFDSAYAVRYSGLPPKITDPRELGLIGRGRHVRDLLEAVIADHDAPEGAQMHADHVLISINNVIGWMKMEDGVTKAERQPRVDMTRQYDAPKEFWLSSSDTGWAHEAFAQAVNILKAPYDNVAEARPHAAAMAELIRKYMRGLDANRDGNIAPVLLEGGLETAVQHAGFAGFTTR